MSQSPFIECDTDVLRSQIGRMNILAISGGRVEHRPTGVTLPVSNGYSVTVDLDASDTYTVRRVFTRSGVAKVFGEVTYVYAEDVGEQAYQASSFRSNSFGGHTV